MSSTLGELGVREMIRYYGVLSLIVLWTQSGPARRREQFFSKRDSIASMDQQHIHNNATNARITQLVNN